MPSARITSFEGCRAICTLWMPLMSRLYSPRGMPRDIHAVAIEKPTVIRGKAYRNAESRLTSVSYGAMGRRERTKLGTDRETMDN